MEVRIEALPGHEAPPEDTFVALRVGDVQKQSRFSDSRTYRFPDPGDERGCFGRIEVFQRVGVATLSLDASASSPTKCRHVKVPCQYNLQQRDCLDLNVSVQGPALQAFEAAEVSERRSKARQRMDAVHEYLSRHSLEELLADALKEVVQSKPKDPHAFLSSYILSRTPAPQGGSGSMLPPISPSRKAMEMDVLGDRPASKPRLSRSGSRSHSRGEKLPPLDEAPAAPPIAAALKPLSPKAGSGDAGAQSEKKACRVWNDGDSFQQYYTAHFLLAGNDAFAGIHAKFVHGSQAVPTDKKTHESAESMPVLELLQHEPGLDFTTLPSVGTWHSNRLLRSHKMLFQPESGGAQQLAESLAKESVAQDFRQLPSTGTWLSPRFSATETGLENSILEPQSSEAPVDTVVLESQDFRKLPSTGTWLSPRLAARTNSPLAVDSDEPQALAELVGILETKSQDFRKLPSTGTWLSYRPPPHLRTPFEAPTPEEAVLATPVIAAQDFTKLPSTGTWLSFRSRRVTPTKTSVPPRAPEVEATRSLASDFRSLPQSWFERFTPAKTSVPPRAPEVEATHELQKLKRREV
eukprot:TRINITY_DN3791_c0_g1_i4.p1 TRINITY_DN3791_c0_g1~~TRINITY_DN3791_c0_g1_i4.p1  ORF type:complete len:579 (-),score=106.43 TRINITY_DN3791_c0_g1_i4:798-2534(-)